MAIYLCIYLFIGESINLSIFLSMNLSICIFTVHLYNCNCPGAKPSYIGIKYLSTNIWSSLPRIKDLLIIDHRLNIY